METKNPITKVLQGFVAERAGFEPAEACASPVFKTGALNQLDHLSIDIEYADRRWT